MGIGDHRIGLGPAALALLLIAAVGVARAENPPLPARSSAPLPSGLRVPPSPLLDFGAPALPVGAKAATPEEVIAPIPESQPAEAYETIEAPAPAGPCCCVPNRWRDAIKPWLQETHWGYPELFEEAPAGSSVRAFACRQIQGGLAAQLALYRYDFYDEVLPEGAKLNAHGQRRLEKMAALLQSGVYPLVIERAANNPKLDAQRRQNVLAALKNPTFEVPAPWVVLGRPAGQGLSGTEAVEVYKNMLEHTRSGSQGASMGGGGATGAVMPVMVSPASGGGNGGSP